MAARERLLACGVVEGPREVQVTLRRIIDAFEDERGNEVLPFRLERVGGQVIHLQGLLQPVGNRQPEGGLGVQAYGESSAR